MRTLAISLAAVFSGALAMSACGGSSTPGVLTQADIPSYLGIKLNPSAAAAEGSVFGSDPHCKKTGNAVFTVSGWKWPRSLRTSMTPVVLSGDDSCTTASDAQLAFKTDKVLSGRPIPGIGDEATLIDLSAGQRNYGVAWREESRIGAVFVVGPSKDQRITPALAESLARRAAAGS